MVDDGSTDNSGQICDKYAKEDNRIIALHKENGGQSSARNYALKISSGDFIMFIDSDDLLLDDQTLSLVSKYITSHPEYITSHPEIDIVQFPHVRFDISTPLTISRYYNEAATIKILKSTKEYIEHTDIINSVSPTDIILKTAPWAKLYRREIFESICFPEGMVL